MTTKLILGPGRLSFPNIFKARKNDRGEDVYGTAFLLPPDYNLDPIKVALVEAMKAKFGPKEKWPQKARHPKDVIVRAAEKDPDGKYGYAAAGLSDWWVLSANGTTQPGVIDAAKVEVLDPREAYPGRWARISVNAFAYDNKTKGVTLGLNNVQLLKHDTSLGGRSRAEDDFDAYAAEEQSMAMADEDWS